MRTFLISQIEITTKTLSHN